MFKQTQNMLLAILIMGAIAACSVTQCHHKILVVGR